MEATTPSGEGSDALMGVRLLRGRFRILGAVDSMGFFSG